MTQTASVPETLAVAAQETFDLVSGAEAMVQMLDALEVRHLFGLCGDTSLPFYDALARLHHGIFHVLTRDERSAAYMADAYARLTGKVGVCEGPSGGGATYILPGVVEANESSIALLAITTDVSTTSRGRYTLTELDQEALFAPLTKWNTTLARAADVPRMLRAAFVQMTTGRPGAVHLSFPFDAQKECFPADDVRADTTYASFPAQRCAPDSSSIEHAAAILRSARAPRIIVGGGVTIAGAHDELAALAELLDAPVGTTISGKGSLSDAHPLSLGVVGSNGGTAPVRAVIAEADCVLFIGCRAGSVTTERWRRPGRETNIVHIDVDPAVIGANYSTIAPVVGDAKLALAGLLQAFGRKFEPRGSTELVAAAKREKFLVFEELAASDERPIRPERLVDDLQAVLPRDAVVVADPGTPCPYLSAYLTSDVAGRWFITNRAHGALGYSLAAACGAQFARPNAKVVSVMGDGSFGFTAGELETVVRYNLPITFIVVSNSEFGWIKAGQKNGFGARYYSVDFTRTDHARVAEAFGLRAWRVEDPRELRGVLAAAMAYDGPTLVDVISQPLEEANAPVSEWIA
ncbi:MAG TPA: thiamine pyrophosphate-binding protein [Candidatus Baltobacteraceae bacterium]